MLTLSSIMHYLYSQAFPSGVPETQVGYLGSVSRVATLDDISKWDITKVDTLAALMKSDDGSWEEAKVQWRGILQVANILVYILLYMIVYLMCFTILFRAKQSSPST